MSNIVNHVKSVLGGILRDGHQGGQLRWGLPEQWVQTELYARLKRAESVWGVMDAEVPYVTRWPVSVPKVTPAVKYIDLCLHDRAANRWAWVELKVRSLASRWGADEITFARLQRSAWDAFLKDTLALQGFDLAGTAETWRKPPPHVAAYWMERLLKEPSAHISSGTHHMLSLYVQLETLIDRASYWSDGGLEARLTALRKNRLGGDAATMPQFAVSAFGADTSVAIAEWVHGE